LVAAFPDADKSFQAIYRLSDIRYQLGRKPKAYAIDQIDLQSVPAKPKNIKKARKELLPRLKSQFPSLRLEGGSALVIGSD
jgi:hypothetical protein